MTLDWFRHVLEGSRVGANYCPLRCGEGESREEMGEIEEKDEERSEKREARSEKQKQ
jgi:hypothetical protein